MSSDAVLLTCCVAKRFGLTRVSPGWEVLSGAVLLSTLVSPGWEVLSGAVLLSALVSPGWEVLSGAVLLSVLVSPGWEVLSGAVLLARWSHQGGRSCRMRSCVTRIKRATSNIVTKTPWSRGHDSHGANR